MAGLQSVSDSMGFFVNSTWSSSTWKIFVNSQFCCCFSQASFCCRFPWIQSSVQKSWFFYFKAEQIFSHFVNWRNPWLILLLFLWHFFATTWQWTCHEINAQKSYPWECKVTTSKSGDNLKKSQKICKK